MITTWCLLVFGWSDGMTQRCFKKNGLFSHDFLGFFLFPTRKIIGNFSSVFGEWEAALLAAMLLRRFEPRSKQVKDMLCYKMIGMEYSTSRWIWKKMQTNLDFSWDFPLQSPHFCPKSLGFYLEVYHHFEPETKFEELLFYLFHLYPICIPKS